MVYELSNQSDSTAALSVSIEPANATSAEWSGALRHAAPHQYVLCAKQDL